MNIIIKEINIKYRFKVNKNINNNNSEEEYKYDEFVIIQYPEEMMFLLLKDILIIFKIIIKYLIQLILKIDLLVLLVIQEI